MVQLDKFSVRVLRADGQPAHEDDKGRVPLRDGTVYKISLKNYHDRDASAEISIDGRPVGVYLVKAKSKLIVENPLIADGKFTFYKVSSGPGKELKEDDQTRDDLGLIKVTFTLLKKKLNEKSAEDLLKEIKRAFEEQSKRPINIYPSITIYDSDPWWWYRRYRPSPWWEASPVIYCNNNTNNPGAVISTFTATSSGSSGSGSFEVSHSIDLSDVTKATPLPHKGVVTSGFHQVQNMEPGITGLTGESDKVYEEAPEDKSLFDEDSVRHLYLRLVAADEEIPEGPRRLPRSTPIPPPV